MNPIISVENLTKTYRLGTLSTGAFLTDLVDIGKKIVNKNAFSNKEFINSVNNVSFDIFDGDIVGIVGGNGAGKSTLLKLLSRVTIPTSGKISITGKMSSLLEVGTGFHPELTGRENIFLNGTILGMKKSEIQDKLEQIVEFSGVEKFLDTPVKRYSSGMVVRLGFSVAAFLEPDILVVDEVLAVGDSQFQERCLRRLKDISSQGRVVLFVSHNLQSIKKLCTRGLLMNKGELLLDSGIDDVIDRYLVKYSEGIVQGIIPEELERQYSTGEVLLTKVQLVNNLFEIKSNFLFREPFKILVDVKLKAKCSDVYLALYIINSDGEKVAYFDRNLTDTLKALGGNSYCLIVDTDLTPGKYSVLAALNNENGGHYDYIESCYEFEILRVSYGNHNKYSGGVSFSGMVYKELGIE